MLGEGREAVLASSTLSEEQELAMAMCLWLWRHGAVKRTDAEAACLLPEPKISRNSPKAH